MVRNSDDPPLNLQSNPQAFHADAQANVCWMDHSNWKAPTFVGVDDFLGGFSQHWPVTSSTNPLTAIWNGMIEFSSHFSAAVRERSDLFQGQESSVKRPSKI